MAVFKLIVILVITGALWFIRMSQVDPPAVLVMDWSNLSQQLANGSSNFGMDFMPALSGTKEMPMRAPTCENRFNGLQFTRHFAGGFYFSSRTPFVGTGSPPLSI